MRLKQLQVIMLETRFQTVCAFEGDVSVESAEVDADGRIVVDGLLDHAEHAHLDDWKPFDGDHEDAVEAAIGKMGGIDGEMDGKLRLRRECLVLYGGGEFKAWACRFDMHDLDRLVADVFQSEQDRLVLIFLQGSDGRGVLFLDGERIVFRNNAHRQNVVGLAFGLRQQFLFNFVFVISRFFRHGCERKERSQKQKNPASQIKLSVHHK